MQVEINKLFEFFLYAHEVGCRYPLITSLRSSPKLKEFLDDLDPNQGLDWSAKSYYGLPELRKRVIDTVKYKDFAEESVLITAGANEANFLVIMQTVNPGDEVVLEMPGWPQPFKLCQALGAKIKVISRREDLEWGYSFDELNELVTRKTKLIFVNSPNNPTGAVFDEKDMKKLCEIAKDNGAYLLSDEVYRGTEYGHLSPAAANYYDKAISTSSVSKALGMQGIRTGWMVTKDKKLVDKCMILREDTSEIMNVLGEYIALAALKPEKYCRLIDEAKEQGSRNWKVVDKWISKSDVFSWVKPKAGFLSFPKFNLKIGSEEFCKKLLAEPYRTLTMPGIAYDFDDHIRLGVGQINEETVKSGLEQIEKLVRTLC